MCVSVSVSMSCVYLSVLRMYVILYSLNEFVFAKMCDIVCLVQYDYVTLKFMRYACICAFAF